MPDRCAAPRDVEFRLLGPFSVFRDGHSVDHAVTGPARMLLIYLLAHPGQRLRREHLAETVWPEGAPPSRSAFNTTLWRLKKFLADLPGVTVEAEADALQLHLAPPTRLDAVALVDAAARLTAGQDAPNCALLADLRAAVDAWRGPFAEGLSAGWVLVMREHLHNSYIHLLTALMRDAGRTKRFDEALEYGRRILDEDPFREGAHCEVMWLCVLTGQRAKAIILHRAFCSVLKRELGINPMAETAALFDYIRTGLEWPAEASGDDVRAPLTARRYEGFLQAVERSRASVYAALQAMHSQP